MMLLAMSKLKTGSEITKTHKDDSLEWRINGGRGKVGGNRDASSTVPPAGFRVILMSDWRRGSGEKKLTE